MVFNKKRSYLFLGISIITLILLSYFLGRASTKKTVEVARKAKFQTGYKYISPLLECSLTENNVASVKSLENNLRKYVESAKKEKNVSDVSIYFHDLTGGNWIAINRGDKFSPASLLKVPIMIAYLKLEEKYPGLLQEEVEIDDLKLQTVNPNIMPLKSIQPNQTYTIEELIFYAIHYSDNRAANKLIELIDPEHLDKVYTEIGLEVPGIEKIENFMNVMDYASFFEILYNASYLNKEMSEKALKMLTQSSFNYGLVSGVPINVEVAHKFGERIFENYKQLHDCGIIYKKDNPYLLCIMTRGNLINGDNFNDLAMVIKKISEKVYNSFGE